MTSGSNRRRTTSVDPSPTPTIVCMNPSAWNIGTHISVTSPRPERHLAEQPADQRQRARLRARRALRRAGRAAGQDRDPRPLGGLRRGAPVGAVDQRVERVVAGLVRPGAEPSARRIVDPRERLRVLVVVDEQIGSLALRHLADLGPGERGVEQHDPSAALGGGEHRLEEAAMVTREDRHALAGLEPVLAPGVGERVRALVELLVAELAALVDHHGTVAVAQRAGHERATEQAVALESDQQLGEALRRLGAEQPAAHAQRGEVRLVAGALGELGGAADQTLRVERGIDDGLGVQVDDGTLLLLRPCHCFIEFCSSREGSRRSGVRCGGARDLHTARTAQIIRAWVAIAAELRRSSLLAMTWRRRRPHAAAASPSLGPRRHPIARQAHESFADSWVVEDAMAGKLISLPLRVSLRSAQLLTRAAGGVAGRALSIPGHAIQVASPGRSSAPRATPTPRPAPASRTPSRHRRACPAAATAPRTASAAAAFTPPRRSLAGASLSRSRLTSPRSPSWCASPPSRGRGRRRRGHHGARAVDRIRPDERQGCDRPGQDRQRRRARRHDGCTRPGTAPARPCSPRSIAS